MTDKRVINKARGPQPDDERNKAIVRDYLSGLSTADLVARYGVSTTRLYFIIRREQKRNKK